MGADERPSSGGTPAALVPWRIEYDPAAPKRARVFFRGVELHYFEAELDMTGLPSATLKLRFPFVSIKPVKVEVP